MMHHHEPRHNLKKYCGGFFPSMITHPKNPSLWRLRRRGFGTENNFKSLISRHSINRLTNIDNFIIVIITIIIETKTEGKQLKGF